MATLLGGYGLTESRHGGNIYDNKKKETTI